MLSTLIILLLPAALLCVITMTVASYFGATTRGDKKAINAGIVRSLPYVLILNHAVVFAVLLAILRAKALDLSSIGMSISAGQDLLSETFLGLVAGLALYSIGRFLIDPLTAMLQRNFGGYRMDQGERGQTSTIPWFIAAVILAAVVEESVFRGYALTQLTPALGLVWAVIISSISFGLLHWAYGWWGMASTVVYGVLFALLFVWRQSLIAPVVAHALHNLINILVRQKART